MTAVDEEARAAVLNRLRRAQGQLAGVIAMVEERPELPGRRDPARGRVAGTGPPGFKIVASNMRPCLRGESAMTIEELERLFLTLA